MGALGKRITEEGKEEAEKGYKREIPEVQTRSDIEVEKENDNTYPSQHSGTHRLASASAPAPGSIGATGCSGTAGCAGAAG